MGRDAALEELHQQLQQEKPVAVTAAVAGMGGIGKTELAIQYARGHWKTHYPAGVCWLRCRGADLTAQVTSFATVTLGVSVPEELKKTLKPQEIAQWVWQRWPVAEGGVDAVLVVLDDVTDYGQVRDYLPRDDRFHVLMTTRVQNLGASVQTVALDLLSPEAALELLGSLETAGRVAAEPEMAVELCDRLGYLPLGVELVGRYLRQKPDLSLEKMLARLEKTGLNQNALKKKRREDGTDDMTAERGVEKAIALSWGELKREETRRLAYLLSLFALAPIPWGLVAGCLPEEDEEDLEDARDRLVGLSLVRRVDAGVYQLHQLVREYVEEKLEALEEADEIKRDYCRGMVAVARQVPQVLTVA